MFPLPEWIQRKRFPEFHCNSIVCAEFKCFLNNILPRLVKSLGYSALLSLSYGNCYFEYAFFKKWFSELKE